MRVLYGEEPMLPSRLAAQLGLTRGAFTKLAHRRYDKESCDKF
jgi:hypothetical protein